MTDKKPFDNIRYVHTCPRLNVSMWSSQGFPVHEGSGKSSGAIYAYRSFCEGRSRNPSNEFLYLFHRRPLTLVPSRNNILQPNIASCLSLATTIGRVQYEGRLPPGGRCARKNLMVAFVLVATRMRYWAAYLIKRICCPQLCIDRPFQNGNFQSYKPRYFLVPRVTCRLDLLGI